MADNLRITTPLTGQEGGGRVRPGKEPLPTDAINPARVTSRAGKGETAQNPDVNLTFHGDSVFQKFVETLRRTPPLSESVGRLLRGAADRPGGPEGGASAQALLRALWQGVGLERGPIADALSAQQQGATKFSGGLFQVLRGLAGQDGTDELNASLGRFLKAYEAYLAAPANMALVSKELEILLKFIPRNYREPLEGEMAALLPGGDRQTLEHNLRVLKQAILPLLGRFISATNERGDVRDRISLLVNNLARLNSSSPDEVAGSFEELVGYCRYRLNLSRENAGQLRELLAQSMGEPEKKTSPFLDALVKVLSSESRQGLSGAGQSLIKDTVAALLLDQSVYMPYTHVFLPLRFQDTFTFLDMWVDKEGGEGSSPNGERPLHIRLSLDMREFGTVELSLSVTGMNVSLALSYPSRLEGRDGEIRQAMADIFTRSGMNPETIVTRAELPDFRRELLDKVSERRLGVDVTA